MDDTVYLAKCFFSFDCYSGSVLREKKEKNHFTFRVEWASLVRLHKYMEQRENTRPKAKRTFTRVNETNQLTEKKVEITVTISASIQFTPTKHFSPKMQKKQVKHKNTGPFISICSMNTEQCFSFSLFVSPSLCVSKANAQRFSAYFNNGKFYPCIG